MTRAIPALIFFGAQSKTLLRHCPMIGSRIGEQYHLDGDTLRRDAASK